MGASVDIARYTGDLENLMSFFHLSTGLSSEEGIRRLIAIEKARGTRYYVAKRGEGIVGMIGVWFDEAHQIDVLEPPEIIDLAVAPDYRRQGIGRALMARAIDQLKSAGYHRLWLYTGGHDFGTLRFYRSLGYQLISAVPDWFGDGSTKAILRLDF